MKILNLLLGIIIVFAIISCSSDGIIPNENPERSLKLIKKMTGFKNDEPWFTRTFEYDDNRLVTIQTENTITKYSYNEDNLTHIRTYTYNASTNAFDIEVSRYEFEYENNIIKSRFYYSNGVLIRRLDYSFNNDGKPDRIVSYRLENDQLNLESNTIYEYSTGNLVYRKETFEPLTLDDEKQTQEDNATFDDKNSPFINLEINARREIGQSLWYDALSDNNRLKYSRVGSFFGTTNNPLFGPYSYDYQYDSDNFPLKVTITELDFDNIFTIFFEYE
jgi:hypothetical protein